MNKKINIPKIDNSKPGINSITKFATAPTLPLIQAWINPNTLPTEQGTAKIAWNDNAICFLMQLENKNPNTKATQNNQKMWELGDTVETFIKPGIDQTGYWEVHVTPNNLLMDIYIKDRTPYMAEKITFQDAVKYNSNAQKHVTIDSVNNIWTIELQIPWQTFNLQHPPKIGTQWQFAICRYNYNPNNPEPELSSTAYLTKLSFHNYEDYHTLIIS